MAERPTAGSPAAPPDSPAETDPLAAIDALGQGAPGAKIQVYRVDPNDRRGEAFVATFPCDDFDPEFLAAQHGGGEYIFRVRLPDGTVRGQRRLTIAARLTSPAPPVVAASPPPAAAPPAPAITLSDVVSIFRELVTESRTAASSSRDRELALQEQLLKLATSDGGRGGSLRYFMEGIRLGREIENKPAAGAGGETGVDALAQSLASLFNKQATTAASTPAPAAAPANGHRERTGVDLSAVLIFLPMLERAAIDNVSPYNAADSIVSMIPATRRPQLDAVIWHPAGPEAVARAIASLPVVRGSALATDAGVAWLGRLVLELKQARADQDAEEQEAREDQSASPAPEDPVRPGGDTGEPDSHG